MYVISKIGDNMTKEKYDKSIKVMKTMFFVFLLSLAESVFAFLYSLYFDSVIALFKKGVLSCNEGWNCLVDPRLIGDLSLNVLMAIGKSIALLLCYISLILSIVMIVVMLVWIIVIVHYKEKLRLENNKK